MNEIPFFCVICGEGLCAGTEDAGGFCECPRCLRVVPIPGYPAWPGEASTQAGVFSRDILEIEIKFLCTSCGNKIRGDARLQGQALECPVCRERTGVPEWGGGVPPLPMGKKFAMPVARLSPEEREYLSAVIDDRGRVLVPTGTP